MTYYPDKWMLVKATDGDHVCYKVFASFYGGFTSGQSWKLNSGIDKVEVVDDHYLFHGRSGSIYACHKNCYGAHSYGLSVLDSWEQQFPGGIQPFAEDDAMTFVTTWEKHNGMPTL